eukprot:8989169-Karenia_brevis.AAC.1
MRFPASLPEGQQRKVSLNLVAALPPGGTPCRYLLCILPAIRRKDPFRRCTFQLRFASNFC